MAQVTMASPMEDGLICDTVDGSDIRRPPPTGCMKPYEKW